MVAHESVELNSTDDDTVASSRIRKKDRTQLMYVGSYFTGLGGGMGVFLLPCWFSLINSETVKAVTLQFCSIR